MGEVGVELFSSPLIPPAARDELAQLSDIPLLLATFVVLLALGATAHVLMSTVFHRRRDFAVLLALGMTRRDARLAVLVQATIIALVGIVIGVPLGYVIGRAVWRAVAIGTPVQYLPPAAWAVVLVTPLAALAIAALLSAWPAHRVGTLRVATILRTE
jgi:ABC-type lipoprotein release transport system permease subunit